MNPALQQPLVGFEDSRAWLWLICGPGQRWPSAVRRFVPDLIPPHDSVVVRVCDPTDTPGLLITQSRAIVLWQIEPQNLGQWCERIAHTSIAHPDVLQLAATSELCELSPLELSAISELGVSAILRHIEQLPKLANMIRELTNR